MYVKKAKYSGKFDVWSRDAEMVAGRLVVEQAMDLRYKLRMLGIPLC